MLGRRMYAHEEGMEVGVRLLRRIPRNVLRISGSEPTYTTGWLFTTWFRFTFC
jgi:hypothetical protein